MFVVKESTFSAAASPREEEGIYKCGIIAEKVGSAKGWFSLIITKNWVRCAVGWVVVIEG